MLSKIDPNQSNIEKSAGLKKIRDGIEYMPHSIFNSFALQIEHYVGGINKLSNWPEQTEQ